MEHLLALLRLVSLSCTFIDRPKPLKTLFFKLECLFLRKYRLFKIKLFCWLWSILLESLLLVVGVVLVPLFERTIRVTCVVLAKPVAAYQLVQVTINFIVASFAQDAFLLVA